MNEDDDIPNRPDLPTSYDETVPASNAIPIFTANEQSASGIIDTSVSLILLKKPHHNNNGNTLDS